MSGPYSLGPRYDVWRTAAPPDDEEPEPDPDLEWTGDPLYPGWTDRAQLVELIAAAREVVTFDGESYPCYAPERPHPSAINCRYCRYGGPCERMMALRAALAPFEEVTRG